jgi:hypothetical protein
MDFFELPVAPLERSLSPPKRPYSRSIRLNARFFEPSTVLALAGIRRSGSVAQPAQDRIQDLGFRIQAEARSPTPSTQSLRLRIDVACSTQLSKNQFFPACAGSPESGVIPAMLALRKGPKAFMPLPPVPLKEDFPAGQFLNLHGILEIVKWAAGEFLRFLFRLSWIRLALGGSGRAS